MEDAASLIDTGARQAAFSGTDWRRLENERRCNRLISQDFFMSAGSFSNAVGE